MSEPFQRAIIGNSEYEYTYNAKDNLYTFIVDKNRFGFKQWLWGEKNQIANECTALNPKTSRFEVDVVAFNERMLASTLTDAEIDGKRVEPTLDTVRSFKASLGDQLLMIAQWINSIDKSDGEESDLQGSMVPAGEGNYEVRLNGSLFKLKLWTWGEKNSVTTKSVCFDPSGGELRMDLKAFNESLLLTCLIEAQVNGKALDIDLNTIRGFDVHLGDKLLRMAQEINSISDTEKKTSKTR